MSTRAMGLSFILASAAGGGWVAASLAFGEQYAFVALGVGLLAGVGVMAARVEEHRRTRLGLAAACISALAIFASRFAVMYSEAGRPDPDRAVLAFGSTAPRAVGIAERLQRIDQAGGVHGDLGFYGLMWVCLGSLVSFKVATLGEPEHRLAEDEGADVELPLGEDGLLTPSVGIVALTTPWAAPKDDGLPSLTPVDDDADAGAALPSLAVPQRRAA